MSRTRFPFARLAVVRPLLAFAIAAGAAFAAWPEAARAESANPPLPASLPASSRLDEILLRGVLRVGTTGDYRPFSSRVGTSETFVGLDIALAGELAGALGVRLQIVPTTWPALMNDFAAGR